ncbi:54S ribosomal protein L24 [Pleurostoma richardsiae]|uniref:Large ribosomal subunit protein bL28m n=1 Tax=Pleurostoma richardsiae TaxID=41990 RepID=A0AA38RYI7_9PEZI|nr:54S ribosomal protein L24 [Pleurostoma richardsiae]
MPPSIPRTAAVRCGNALANTTTLLSSPQCHAASRLLSTTSSLLRTGYPAQGRPVQPQAGPAPIPKPAQKTPWIPEYPFGPRRVYKQSNSGLYGAARLRFGNRVSERNEIKTRRKWRPNVHRKRLWSASLGCFVQTRVTTRVLRTLDKAGGLDEYLLGGKAARLRELGPWGWKLRWRVMQTEAVRERFRREREAMGLPPAGEADAAGAGLAELAALGLTEKGLMEETQKMLDQEIEFAIGEDALPEEDGFMREEPRPRV